MSKSLILIFTLTIILLAYSAAGIAVSAYAYDSQGQILSSEYADAGIKKRLLFYNQDNQLVRQEVYDVESSNKDLLSESTYLYDALGRRIEKTVDGDITRFVYSGQSVIQELDGNDNNSVTAINVYGQNFDELVATYRDADGNGNLEKYYAYTSLSGSVEALVDNSGTVAEDFSYTSWLASVVRDGCKRQLRSEALFGAVEK